MESKVRGVGYLVGAARRLYYLVHSHRSDDRAPGNPREARNCLGGNTEREMVSKTESGVWEVPPLPAHAHRSRGGRFSWITKATLSRIRQHITMGCRLLLPVCTAQTAIHYRTHPVGR